MTTHHDMVLARNNQYGEDVRLNGPCNVYDSDLGDGVRIFNFCEVGGAKIGKNTKVSSHSYICPGVEIGEDCFIGHGVMFTNDLFDNKPGEPWIMRKTKVGNRVRIGSNATILCGLTIEDDAIIGAGAVVVRGVKANSTVMGVPAK
jgi:acetyltransferase-like isoleucine patch superfamily enzyme